MKDIKFDRTQYTKSELRVIGEMRRLMIEKMCEPKKPTK